MMVREPDLQDPATGCGHLEKHDKIHLIYGANKVKVMISSVALVALTLGLAVSQTGCSKADQESAAVNPALSAPVPEGMIRGTVLETMDAAGYTYVLLGSGENKVWLAGPKTPVAVGNVVQAPMGMPMTDFHSSALDRDFEVVYFVGGMQNLSTAPAPATATAPVAPSPNTAAPTAAVTDVAVDPVEAGKNIAELFANKAAYADQEVTLRGKVVKYNGGVMGTNFLHIQDGSGDPADGNHDLTVTSEQGAAVGDTVVIKGKLVLDKDFGSGYSYPVIVEDASVTVE